MLRFNNITVYLQRPATAAHVADVLGLKPFELMHPLIHCDIFIAPHQTIDDEGLKKLGKLIGVTFKFEDDGGTSINRIRPIRPKPPPPIEQPESWPNPPQKNPRPDRTSDQR